MTEKDISMRLIKKSIPLLPSEVKIRNRHSQWKPVSTFFILGSLLALAACESSTQTQLGVIGSVDGPLGGVASDEPRATLVAQDILSAGGSAADAATALYFTLAVTYPIAASLGGGGECIVYSKEKNKLENLKFPVGLAKGGGNIGIPGNIRGFAALHARYGKLTWSSLLSPAEKFANFGENMSRAQHTAMITAGRKINFDRQLAKLYKTENGQFKPEGSHIQQVRLSAVLSNIRSNGGAFFYSGNLARAFIEEANRVGGKLATTDLVYYKPVWQDAATFDVDVLTVGTSTSAHGKLYKEIWQKLFKGKGFLQLDQSLPLSAVADASASSFQKYATYNPFGTGGMTSFVTADNAGNAVACTVGMGKPFGSGKVGSITGIVLTSPLTDKQAEFPTSPVLIINRPNKLFFYGAGATGGAAGTLSSVYTALQIFAKDKSLDAAMASPRVFTMGPGLPVLYEKTVPQEEVRKLTVNHPVAVEVEKLGVVNSIYCFKGKPQFCKSSTDPRGFGLSLIER